MQINIITATIFIDFSLVTKLRLQHHYRTTGRLESANATLFQLNNTKKSREDTSLLAN